MDTRKDKGVKEKMQVHLDAAYWETKPGIWTQRGTRRKDLIWTGPWTQILKAGSPLWTQKLIAYGLCLGHEGFKVPDTD